MIQDHLDHGRSNLVQSGVIGSFDLPWSKWSRITDPDPDHPKGTHPKKSPDFCPLDHEWNSSWAKLSCIRFSLFQRNMRFVLNLTLQKVSWFCPFVSAEGGKVNDNAFTEVCSHYLFIFIFFNFQFYLINLADPEWTPGNLLLPLGLSFCTKLTCI